MKVLPVVDVESAPLASFVYEFMDLLDNVSDVLVDFGGRLHEEKP
jgi:hypothetical protein